MQEHNLLLLFCLPLNNLKLRYMVTGSIASTVYGEPRLTNDVDLVVTLLKDDVSKIMSAFPLGEFYCPPEEVILIEMQRSHKGHFNLIHHDTGFKADIYLSGEDPLHKWAMENIRIIETNGGKIPFAPPEYVIIKKLQFYREGGSEKHLRDISSILTVSEKNIDLPKVEELVSELGLEGAWKRVRDTLANTQ